MSRISRSLNWRSWTCSSIGMFGPDILLEELDLPVDVSDREAGDAGVLPLFAALADVTVAAGADAVDVLACEQVRLPRRQIEAGRPQGQADQGGKPGDAGRGARVPECNPTGGGRDIGHRLSHARGDQGIEAVGVTRGSTTPGPRRASGPDLV